MRLLLLLLAAASLFASASVSAQQVYFTTGASALPYAGTARLKLGSANAGTAYVAYDSAYFSTLTGGSQALSSAFAAHYSTGELRFAYDAATSPMLGSGENGAFYSTGAVVARLTDTQGGQASLQAQEPIAFVGDMPAGRFFNIGGALVSPAALSYHDANPASFKLDLVSLLANSSTPTAGTGLDLSAFSSLPIHLTAPGEYRAQSMFLSLGAFAADPAQAPKLSLPTSFDLSIYYDATVSVYFEGNFTLSLDSADFVTSEAFAAAQAWLAANPVSLDVETPLSFHINTLNPQEGGWGGPLGLGADWYVPSAVPEPATAMLWISSLMFGAGVLRSRRRKGAAH